MRRPQFTLKSLLWLTLIVAVFCSGTQLDRYLKDRSDPKHASIRAALNGTTTFSFVEVPLPDVIEYLKALHKVEIQLDTKVMADAGVSSDTSINRAVNDLPLQSALKLILDDLDLTCVVQNGALMITTKAAAPGSLFSLTGLLWFTVALAVLLGSINRCGVPIPGGLIQPFQRPPESHRY